MIADHRPRPAVDDEPASADSGRAADPHRRSGSRASRLIGRSWGLGSVTLVFAALALAAVFAGGAGDYIGDFRFEIFWSPGKVISRLPFLWDTGRDLGRPGSADFHPLPNLLIGFYRSLGASAAVAQRLWHATLLVIGAVGIVQFLRFFRPRLSAEHLLAGAFYMLNPLALVFLVPSPLFMTYALAPWLYSSLLFGSTSVSERWRWAAAGALVLFTSSATELPGTVYMLAFLLPVALYLVLVEGAATWRSVAGWGARVGAVLLLLMPVVIFRTLATSGSLTGRLLTTESVESVSATTSWSESLRGLGNWLTYFRLGERVPRPHQATYLTSVGVILATFVGPLIALSTLLWSRWRPRTLMVGFMALSLLLMVGRYPVGDSMPWGEFQAALQETIPTTTALRNTYKAGFGLMIGVSVLFGYAIVTGTTWLRFRRSRWWLAPVVVACMLLMLLAVPVWTGSLYSPSNRMAEVPAYWLEATTWLDDQTDSGRVLILPGSSQTRYRWGSPGDDIFDALLDRPAVRNTPFPRSTPAGENLVSALDRRIGSEGYDEGTLVPVLQRIGVEYVVVRNDLDWDRMGVSRPAEFDEVRRDPDLELLATFGSPGENTVGLADNSEMGAQEALLPPVEIYRVPGGNEPVRAETYVPPVLLSGDADGWFQLAEWDLLDRDIGYTGQMDNAALIRSLESGSPLVVTDSNLRRSFFATGTTTVESHALAGDAESGRGLPELFARPGSQTIAVYGDATTIDATGTPLAQPRFRPANAFDLDPTTGWLLGQYVNPLGQSLTIELAEPTEFSTMRLTPARPESGGRTIDAVTVVLSDGTSIPARLDGATEIRTVPTQTESIEVRIDGVDGLGVNRVGFDEIAVGGLDLSESLRVPEDIFIAAEADPALAGALENADVSYLFERHVGAGEVPLENAIRRSFTAEAQRTLQLTGRFGEGSLADLAVGGSSADECSTGVLTLNGADVPVRSTTDRLGFEACEPIVLQPGTNSLATTIGADVESVALHDSDSPLWNGADRESVSVEVLGRSPGSQSVSVEASDSDVVLYSGESFHSGWRASIEGTDLGPPQMLDAQAAWTLPPGDVRTVDIDFAPQRTYEALFLVSLLGVVLAVALIVRPALRSPRAKPTGSVH